MNSNSASTLTNMKTKVWDDAEIRKIDTAQLARYAYELSDVLKDQYPSIELFLAHWQGQRRFYRLDSGPFADAGPQEDTIRQEWNGSPSLRAEFGDSFSAYCAFLKAERKGRVRIAGRQ